MLAKPKHLPGDLSAEQARARMLRVDHAGEYGATRIYAGQLAVLGKSPSAGVIEHMAKQEQPHLDYFSKTLVANRVRPTALMPLWHVAGFALGAVTALMGEKAAMACTAAVESVIDEHYAAQLSELGDEPSELKSAITKFRDEEIEHRDTALAHGAEATPLYELLTKVISSHTKMAIWLSTRI